MSADHRFTDATALAQAFAAGEADPTEAMQAALERMERLNPALNAVIHPRPELALAEAEASAQRWSRRRAGGALEDTWDVGVPFDGVPMAIKDLGCEQAGEFHHAGARFLAELGWRGSLDSHLYRLLSGAGLISVGRTNTPEFGTTITTEPDAYGPTANPWSLDRSPGGSSGGSAAAVAAGIVPIAHGNDGGGSIRVPAAACGLVGLKPTRGRVSTAPRLGEHRGGFAVDGMLTRTVRDAARCHDIISRPAPGDPYVAPPLRPGESFADALAAPLRSLPPLRIAVSTGNRGRASAPVRRAVEQAANLLARLGHRIEPDTAPDGWFSGELADHTIVVRTVGMATELAGWAERLGRPMTADDVEPANWWSAELGRSLPAAAYVGALEELARWRRRVMAFWNPARAVGAAASVTAAPPAAPTAAAQAAAPTAGSRRGFDLLMTPVLAGVTPPLGYLADPADGARRIAELAAFVNQANISGQPAISLPTTVDPDGLPLGVQLHAAHGGELLLLAVAQQISDAGGLIPLGDLPREAASTGTAVARAARGQSDQEREATGS
ncbi:amidase [Candidatus Poriferisodalis sp.]|uniref:amidase n=1 Tax=Candidatus Poriferisodalis sp. TaxID=3101277 RepID=UPI003B025B4A